MFMYYILDENKNPVEVELQEFMKAGGIGIDKVVGRDEIEGTLVSTVFLGIDHGFGRSERPILFETMAFSEDKDYDEFQQRYYTWEEAEKGHREIVEKVKNKIPLMDRQLLKIKYDPKFLGDV